VQPEKAKVQQPVRIFHTSMTKSALDKTVFNPGKMFSALGQLDETNSTQLSKFKGPKVRQMIAQGNALG
jgi:hypothetical protein